MAEVQGLGAQQVIRSESQSANQSNAQGVLQGRGFTVNTAAGSLILLAQNQTSSLEELTFSIQEQREKDLGNKKIKDANARIAEQVARIQALIEIAFNVQQRAELKELVNDLLNGNQTPQYVRERLRDLSDSEADQYLALSEIKHQLGKRAGNEEALGVINGYMKELENSLGNALWASINSIDAAQDASALGLSDPQDLRGFYSDAIGDFSGLAGLWREMVNQYGVSRVEPAIAFMVSALAADYQSQTRSLEKPQLLTIMSDMSRLKCMATLHEQSSILCARFSQFPESSTRDLTQGLIALQDEQWPISDHVAGLIAQFDLPFVEQQIQFTVGIKQIVRGTVLDAFTNLEHKQRTIEAIQSVLDDRIASEEDELARGAP